MATEILQAPKPISIGFRQVGFRSFQLDTGERPPPPIFSSLEEIEQGREAAAHFQHIPWLSPPQRQGVVFEAAAEAAEAPPQLQPDLAPAFPFQPATASEEGYKALQKLCQWRNAGKPEDGMARRFSVSLKEFACIATRLDEQARSEVVRDFPRLVLEMLQQRFLDEGHLELLLLAFAATRGWSEDLSQGTTSRFPNSAPAQRPPADNLTWAMRVRRFVCGAVHQTLECLHRLNPEAASRWNQFRNAEVCDADSDIYAEVDVRAWPLICELLSLPSERLAGEALCRQIQLQMCTQGTTRPMKYQWLYQAADLLGRLRLQEQFDEVAAIEEREGTQMGIYATFNDKMLSIHERREVLYTVLKDAPQTLIRKVLCSLDEDIDETERKEDYELRMLQDLLIDLDQDIRRCGKAFFRLKRTWISSLDTKTGVIENEELTPAQFCDHIEDDPQYEILLRDATNRLIKLDRTFEAAKMLARPRAQESKAWNNIKDSQVLYIRSLYEEEKEPEDHFGPMELGSLLLPGSEEAVLRVPSMQRIDGQEYVTNDALAILESELLNGPPVAVGVWWLWRCFNAHLDQHSRAALLALTYRHPGQRDRLVLVDMIALEQARSEDEHYHKNVLGRILNAPHILKVVHFLERTALRALQLAFVTEDVRQGPTKPEGYISVTPCVDVALVTACLRGTSGVHCNELCSLVWDFMRTDMCLAEALGNCERRPLRKTQEHYALSTAWCPLALLRALCSFGLATWVTVLTFCTKIHGDADDNWDEDLLKNLNFNAHKDDALLTEGDPSTQSPEEYDFAGNIWEAEIEVIESGAPHHLQKLSHFVLPREKEKRWVYTSRGQSLMTGEGPEPTDKAWQLVRDDQLQAMDYPLKVVDTQGEEKLLYQDVAEQRLEALRPPPRQENCIIYTNRHTFTTYNEVVQKYQMDQTLPPEDFPLKAFYLKNHKEVKQLTTEQGEARQQGMERAFLCITEAKLGLSNEEQQNADRAVRTLFDIEAVAAEMEALHRDFQR